MILFKQIIQEVWLENLSENIMVCNLSRDGLCYYRNLESFYSEKNFSGNIATSMEEAKLKKPILTKGDKFKAKKAVVPKTKKSYIEKSSKAAIKTASRNLKKSTILVKSETKTNFLSMNFKAKRYFQLS